MQGETENKPWWFFAIAALILSVFIFREQLQGSRLVLIPVGLAFLIGFGVMLSQGIKQWKKPDEEILADYLPAAAFLSGTDGVNPKTHAGNFARTVVTVIVILVFTSGRSGRIPTPFLLFLVVGLLLTGFPLLRAWLGKKRKQAEGPDYRAAAVIALLLGLITTGFICFWIGIGVFHGAWWFVCPPGLIFLSLFARPLVAGLRFLFRREKDPGENHINRRQDADPWDRPDREL